MSVSKVLRVALDLETEVNRLRKLNKDLVFALNQSLAYAENPDAFYPDLLKESWLNLKQRAEHGS